ncbi:hypothetical protein [Desulfovibrio sp.]|uniref:hypothetical protein n=1 Tax=Desulfovibrio sp. TaxID=885 RepID=UPI0025C11462|nr:hypothetical protein [Desulfovibrio sp.]
MGEMGKFLYGQIVVGSSLIQLFRRPFFAVDELHDVRVAAVHAGAVFQLVNGIAVSVDAEALHGRRIICGKRHFFPRRFRLTRFLFFLLRPQRHGGSGLFLFCLYCGGRNVFLPHVVLNIFFPYLLDLVHHYVEQRQLAGIVCLLAPSGHTFLSLSERREGGANGYGAIPSRRNVHPGRISVFQRFQ